MHIFLLLSALILKLCVPTRLRIPPTHDDVVAEICRVVLKTRLLAMVVTVLGVVVEGSINHELMEEKLNPF